MSRKQHVVSLMLGMAIGGGSVVFLANHAAARAADDKGGMTNADYARDANEHLRKAHEDVDHLVNSKTDKSAKGYDDANEAKKAIDRASKALDRYVSIVDQGTK
jgi:hypothetical protein